jgi:hypothetical protein
MWEVDMRDQRAAIMKIVSDMENDAYSAVHHVTALDLMLDGLGVGNLETDARDAIQRNVHLALTTLKRSARLGTNCGCL